MVELTSNARFTYRQRDVFHVQPKLSWKMIGVKNLTYHDDDGDARAHFELKVNRTPYGMTL